MTAACGSYEPSSAGASGTGGAAGSGVDDDGLGGNGGGSGSGTGGESTSPDGSQCTPSPDPDLPDIDGADTNCDGVDGDAAAAVFVAPTGSETAAGTIGDPVQTIGTAIRLAAAEGKAVYVCTATYREALTVTHGVSIYGGYDCGNGWTRTHDLSVIQPARGVPLTIRDVTDEIAIAQLKLVAPDAVVAGASSVAAFIVNSSAVTIQYNEIEAGNGAAGPAGGEVEAVTVRPQQGAAGTSRSTGTCDSAEVSTTRPLQCKGAAAGGATEPVTCETGGTVRGGVGGDGGNICPCIGPPCAAGVCQSPIIEEAGAAGMPSAGVTSGASGLVGSSGSAGSAASAGFGSVSESGYHAANAGADGTPGTPGQSGTGGNGGRSRFFTSGDITLTTYYVGGGGGAGGRGGCGGAGGKGGGAGGASIAVLSVNSAITIDTVRLSTANGGDGGAGSAGASGEAGAFGGTGGTPTGGTLSTGQAGGDGGPGGTGGPGGPGAGGPSIPLVATGIAPTLGAVAFGFGTGGIGAAGADGSAAANGEVTNIKLIDVVDSDGT